MEFHPLAEGYPLLDDQDLFALAEDIKTNGQKYKITVFEGKILDGRNRFNACELAGVEPQYRDLPEDEDPAEFVKSANDQRRHEQLEIVRKRRSRVTRVAESRKGGKSLRTIADEEGVSVVQVQRDLEEASGVPGGGTPEPEGGKVTGRDGKKQSAKKPGRKKKSGVPPPGTPEAKNGETPAREPGEDDDPIALDGPTDALGIEIPESSQSAFAVRDKFAQARKLHRQLSSLVSDIVQEPGGEHLRKLCELRESAGKQRFRLDRLFQVGRELDQSTPHACVCPYCHGQGKKKNHKDCTCCQGLPYVTSRAFEQAPKDYQAAVKALAVEGKS